MIHLNIAKLLALFEPFIFVNLLYWLQSTIPLTSDYLFHQRTFSTHDRHLRINSKLLIVILFLFDPSIELLKIIFNYEAKILVMHFQNLASILNDIPWIEHLNSFINLELPLHLFLGCRSILGVNCLNNIILVLLFGFIKLFIHTFHLLKSLKIDRVWI